MVDSVQVVSIDDHSIGTGFTQECFPYTCNSVTFTASPTIRTAITSENRTAIIEQLRAERGAMLLILDMDLYTQSEDYAAIRREILSRVGDVLARASADGEPGLDLSQAIQELNHLRGLKDPKQLAFIDGLEFGLVAIQNLNLRPLIIRLSTRHPRREEMAIVLQALVEHFRGPNSCCQVGTFGTLSMVEMAERAVANKNVKSEFLRKYIECDVCLKIEAMGRDCSSIDPIDPLRRYLQWISSLDHNRRSATSLQEARVGLLPLLGISEKEWELDLCPHLGPHLKDTLNSSGALKTRGLGVLSAWLFALSAYQQADRSRHWKSVFDPTEISKPQPGWLWSKMSVTPYLVEDPELKTCSLHDAMEHFYKMCLSLFQREGESPEGPLQKVSLSTDEKNILCFRLSFNDEQRTRLGVNINRWRNVYLKSTKSGDHKWEAGLEKGPNSSARAIWNWWLSTAIDDYPYIDNSIFNTSEFFRMRIRKADTYTELVFGDQ